MLRLLLDEHMAHAVAQQLRGHRPALDVVPLAHWHGGAFLGVSDGEILQAARREGRTLVTYDLATIPALLRSWAETGQEHGGVILISRASFPLGDVGGVVQALLALWHGQGDLDWSDRVVSLQP